MGCKGRKRHHVEIRPEHKWDYISLNDFKSTSCWTPFAYSYLYISLLISLAVYSVDSFTAVNLLAFGNWPSELNPAIPFEISRWIFSVCIILSFVNLGFEHIRAQRVMSRGSVAESYLDNLAVRLESIRLGKGQGWKRFLVFAELTKSKKGAEYVALFTYFSFQSWFRVIVCSGPRQVVNALTLYSVYNAKLAASGDNVGNTLMSFFGKIKTLAEGEPRLAVILSGMVFTLVIWVFAILALILAALFFVFFLWSYIPTEDGSLSGYCARKINKRLMTIVSIKINKGIAEEERRRKKAELKAAKKAGELPPEEHKATLPDLGDDKLPAMPSLSRADTMTTLPAYASRPGTPGSFELNSLDQKRPVPSRTATMASSNSNFSTRQPLVGAAAGMGRTGSPAPSLPNMDFNNNYPPARTGTASSNRSFGGQPQMSRMPTNGSLGGGYTSSPSTYSTDTVPALPRPAMSPRMGPQGYPRPQQGSISVNGAPASSRLEEFSLNNYSNGRASPAPSMQSYRGTDIMSPRGPMPQGPMSQGGPGYPQRSATGPLPPRGTPGPQFASPQRNMTAPVPLRQPGTPAIDYDYRPSTSGSQAPRQPRGYGGGYDADLESQRGTPGPRY